MALTAAGRRLTESHRLAQGRIGVDTARLILNAWRALDVTDLDRTTAGWLRIVVPLIERQNARSAQLAASYYRLFRATELGAPLSEFTPSVRLTAEAQRVVTSMTVVGPVSVKRAMARGVELQKASETAATNTARSAHRLALDGSRATLTASVEADPRVAGWQRVTSGSPCKFCAALAGRGVAYKESTVDFAAHDGCSCSAEPVFDSGDSGERRAVREFQQREMTADRREAANAAIRRWLAE